MGVEAAAQLLAVLLSTTSPESPPLVFPAPLPPAQLPIQRRCRGHYSPVASRFFMGIVRYSFSLG
ncbi:MAG: hypothetical protein ABI693_27470 [Bryobacteraceae bacterium]